MSNSNWPLGKPNSLTTHEEVENLGERLKRCSSSHNDIGSKWYWYALAEEAIMYTFASLPALFAGRQENVRLRATIEQLTVELAKRLP